MKRDLYLFWIATIITQLIGFFFALIGWMMVPLLLAVDVAFLSMWQPVAVVMVILSCFVVGQARKDIII